MPNAAKPDRASLSDLPTEPSGRCRPPASGATARRLSGDPPVLNARLRQGLPSAIPEAFGPRRGAAPPLTPGTAPRRWIATGRDQTQREPPPLPHPRSPAPLHRKHRRRSATSPCSAVRQRPRGRKTPAPRKPSGTQSPRQALPPGAPGLALPAVPPRPAGRQPSRRPILTKGLGTAPLAESRQARRWKLRLPAGTPLPCSRPPAALAAALRRSPRPAKDYARSAQADNTQRAYAADWKMFASWLRRQGLPETPPDPEAVGLYLAAQVERRGAELSIATLERRLSGIAWRYRQLGEPLDIRDRHIATVLAGIRRRHGRPPARKRQSSPTNSWPCWRPSIWICAAFATGRFWRSASPAACADPKSSASIAGPARPRTAPAGSNSSPKGRS